MVRNYILSLLIMAFCFSPRINCSETKPKPVILAVSIGSDIRGFVPFLQELAPIFDVKTKNIKDVTAGDLVNVIFVFFYAWIGENEIKKFPDSLNEDVKRFDNKALIIFNQSGFPLPAIAPGVKKLFNDNIFQLHMKATGEFIQNVNSSVFERWFQEHVLSFCTKGQIILYQRVEKLAHDQELLNKEIARLNQEIAEIIKQLKR